MIARARFFFSDAVAGRRRRMLGDETTIKIVV
jgi:hypothetical protein